MVTIDALDLVPVAPELQRDGLHQRVHHRLALGISVPLRPEHVLQVRFGLLCANHQVREIAVFEGNALRRAGILRDPDVRCGEQVADSARAGVQQQPDLSARIFGNLDEVVARAERAELDECLVAQVGRAPDERRVIDAGREPVVLDESFRLRERPFVAGADARGDQLSNILEDSSFLADEVVPLDVRLHGNHPAANVDADGVGHDRLLRLERAADRRAEAEVGIRHKREVALDDRQPANALGLPHRRLVDYRRPGLDGSLSVFVFGLDGFNHGA